MPTFSRDVIAIVSHLASRAKAPEQGGILTGSNPAAFNSTDPIQLWVIQVAIIISFTQLLSYVFSKIRQPRVIAEVIAGVILGPTIMGRIPNFSNSIFPTASLPYLNLTATIGLVLFLFLVGLETDLRMLKRNARSSLSISIAGMVIPFALGICVAIPLYHRYIDEKVVSFGNFLLFAGVAFSITAFPVLCRILTELKLLETTVGVVVLSAGVGNDIVGWVLLALSVALVNAGSGITALWVLLTCVGWTLFLMFPVKYLFLYMARKTGSIENGHPTMIMMTFTLLLVFVSAFFTDVIGVHPIFGAFLVGLIVPSEGGFAIALVEKIEDLVSILLLPLYFILSGLKTNLGLLDDGIIWGYVVLCCVVAFIGKFAGCAITARLCGFNVRESGAIGTLMSCKGLVELIVLNVGLSAGVLDTRTFSMFVVMALVLTFVTTPLTLVFYPPEHRTTHVASDAQPKISGVSDGPDSEKRLSTPGDVHDRLRTRISVVLDKVEHLPAIMTFVQLLQPAHEEVAMPSLRGVSSEVSASEKDVKGESFSSPSPRVTIDALRLIELTDRTSAVMKSSAADELIRRDSLVNIFRTFGRLNRIPVMSALSVVNYDLFSVSVASHAAQADVQLVVVPWTSKPSPLESENHTNPSLVPSGHNSNPFDTLFGKPTISSGSSPVHSEYVRKVFADAPADVALVIDRGMSAAGADSMSGIDGQHFFLPFFGGPDDRAALSLVLQLCRNPGVSATILRVTKSEPLTDLAVPTITRDETEDIKHNTHITIQSTGGFQDTIYPQATPETRMESQTADNLLWSRYTDASPSPPISAAIESALSRVRFDTLHSPIPLHAIVNRATEEAKSPTIVSAGKSLFVITGRSRRLAVESHLEEVRQILTEHGHSARGEESRKTVGDVATAFMVATAYQMLVIQAKS